MQGRAGMGWVGSKKFKPNPAPPYGAGLKSCPILTPPPLQGGANLREAKWGGAGQVGQGKITFLKPKACLWDLVINMIWT